MRILTLSLLFLPFTAFAETCPKIQMKPGVNPRLYQNLAVPKNCTAESVFTCPGGELIRTEYASSERLHIGARCFRPNDPELARLRPRGRETLNPQSGAFNPRNGALGPATAGSERTPRIYDQNQVQTQDAGELKRKALAAGVPDVVFERALKNYLEMKRQGKTERDCFLAADMTSPGQGSLFEICARPEIRITKMPTHYGSGAGRNCESHVYKNTSEMCATYFGNRPNYCLTAGGNYITQNVTRQRGTERPFVELLGLDAGENDNADRRNIGIHATSFANGRDYIGRTDRAEYSNGCITVPTPARAGTPPTPTLDPVSLSAQSDQGGMALYVYPAKQDVLAMQTRGQAEYWHKDCAKQERRPAWIGESPSDGPSPEDESQRQLADWLNLELKAKDGRE